MAKHHPDLVFCRKQPGIGKMYEWLYLIFNGLQQLGVSVKNVLQIKAIAMLITYY